jgi:hypothetical protein
MIAARPGMRIRRQYGAREIAPNDASDHLPFFPLPEPRSGGA